MTLGSLFDGSGGFPLAGVLSGITPVWASEIEPFPVRVTTKRLPFMKHLGDIHRINGAKIEPVDIITFGSPCQNLSVAGDRKGLSGSRSNLFFEAIRIIKEMRDETNGKFPRYAVWENVPGAFSSHCGENFRTVLESFCSVKDKKISIPRSKKWTKSGVIMGNDFSVAWRVLDAQFWGVPQRRKRIYLVADFSGRTADKVLFESENLPRHSNNSVKIQRTITDFSKKSLGEYRGECYCINAAGCMRMYVTKDITGTLLANGANRTPVIMYSNPDYEKRFSEISAAPVKNSVRKITPLECARLQGFPDDWTDRLETDEPTEEDLLFWRDYFSGKTDKQIIRWLKHPYSDSAAYKMWGNGVALPCVYYVLFGITYWAKLI